MLTLLGIFAATALVLACIGIYGVMAYAVTQRTREMGIRIALGAGAGQVIALVMRSGMKLVLIGLGIGAACSVGAGLLIASQLYNVSKTDPAVFALVALALLTATMAACWLPGPPCHQDQSSRGPARRVTIRRAERVARSGHRAYLCCPFPNLITTRCSLRSHASPNLSAGSPCRRPRSD